MALRFQDNQGIQALDPNQIIEAFSGNSVISGCSVTDGTNALEADIASGSAIVAGSEVSVNAQTVTLDSGDADNPRKDIIYIDDTGTAQVAKGTPEDPEPEGAQRFDLFQPAPPSRDNVDGAVVAEIFVGANASDFGSSDIRDRRLISDLTVSSLISINDLDLTSNNILNLAEPVNAQDAATKNYVDSEVTDSQLDVQDDGTSVLADAEALNFKGSHFDATDDGSSVAGIDITSGSLENSLLVNSSLTVAGNLVSLGGSTTVDYVDLNDTGASFPIPNSDLANSSVTFAGQTASLGSSASISIDNLSDVASSSESAGQLPIWNATNTQYENAALTGGNAISVANGDASVTLSVPTDGIGTDELDESAAYSFTGLGATTITGGDLDLSDNNINNVQDFKMLSGNSESTFVLAGTAVNDATGGKIDFKENEGNSTAFRLQHDGSVNELKVTSPFNSIDIATFSRSGGLALENGSLNIADSTSIQDAGTDAIQFDGTQNVTIPNGGLNKNQVYSRMSLSTNTAVSSSTVTTVPYDSSGNEDSDVLTVDRNTGQITVQQGGSFLVRGLVTFDTDSGWSTGDRVSTRIAKNGSLRSENKGRKVGTNDESFSHEEIIDATSGDTIEITVFQDSGAQKTIKGTTEQTRFFVEKIG